MPVEALQIHIGGVGNGDVVAHLISGQHCSVAALGNGNAQLGSLIVSIELDDLTCVLQCHIKHLGGHLPIGRGGYLSNLIAGQRQGLTGCHTTGIGGDIVHDLAAAGIDDFINSTLERCAGGGACDFVVLAGILVNLDLTGNGFILPFNLHGPACTDIDRLHLSVHIIALIFQLTDVVATGLGETGDIHPAVLIGLILADGGLVAVIEQEGHTVNSFTSGAIGFVDQDAGQALVLHGKGGGLSVLHLEVVGCIVQLKPICGFDFDRIVGAILQSQEHTAILICGHGIHKAIVCATDLELHIGDALGLLVGIDLDDLNTAHRIVVEVQALRVVGVHNHRLAAGLLVDGVTRNALYLSHYDRAGDAVDLDLSIFIGPVQAVGGKLTAICVNYTSIGVGNLELNTFQRLLSHGILLVDHEIAQGLVEELQHIGLMILDFDGLGGIVQQVALGRLHLGHDQAGRLHLGDGDIAVFVSSILAASGADRSAVSSSHTENRPGQRFFGNGVHLLDDKATQRHILESDFLAVAGLYLNGMHGVIQQIAILCGNLQNGVAAAGDVLQADDAVFIGGVSSCGILTAITASNLELHAAQRLAGDAVNLGDQQAAVGNVVEGKGLGIIRIDNDGLAPGLGVDAIAINSLLLGHDQCAADIGENDLAVGIRHVGTLGGELAALGVHIGAVSVGDFELHALQGFAGHGIQLVDNEIALGLVPELQRYGLACFDADGLGRIVQNVCVVLGAGLLHHQSGAGVDALNQEGACAVGGELAVGVSHHSAVRGGHKELNIGQGFFRHAVDFLDQ